MTDNTTNVVTTRIDYSAIKNLSDAIAASEAAGNAIVSSGEVLGDGFALLATKDKDKLVGIPVFFIGWSFHQGDQGEFVSAHVIAKSDAGDARYILNDGGTGIYAQLKRLNDQGITGGLMARQGLRRSDYTNEHGNATTYYISETV
jgi:hypothetical protein